MKSYLTKQSKALAVAAIALAFAGCTKDSSTSTTNPDAQVAIKAGTSAMGKTPGPITDNQVGCNQGTLGAPSGSTLAYGPGTVLAVNQPSGETPVPSSIVYGPTVGASNGFPGYPKYRLTLQGDANLVLYLNNTTTSLWNSRTATGGANKQINCYLILQGDGNLVLKDRLTTGSLAQYWAAQDVLTCSPAPTPKLYFQSDGNIVEEFPASNGLWGVLGNTGTGGGGNKSNHSGSF